MRKTVLNHADLLIKLRDEQSAMREFRKHLTWYLDVLDKKPILKLLKEKANKIETLKDVVDIIKEYGSE